MNPYHSYMERLMHLWDRMSKPYTDEDRAALVGLEKAYINMALGLVLQTVVSVITTVVLLYFIFKKVFTS